jgi:hypothetical protein
MADLFLRAVRDLHEQRAKVRRMTPERGPQMFDKARRRRGR